MNPSIDPVDLASRLIACPSITPATGEVFDVLEEALAGAGFEVHRFILGEAPDGPVENLFATRGSGAPHFGFAGHLDVVPPGAGWASDPFAPEINGGLLYGRGAVDMKSSIAAFVAAAAEAGHTLKVWRTVPWSLVATFGHVDECKLIAVAVEHPDDPTRYPQTHRSAHQLGDDALQAIDLGKLGLQFLIHIRRTPCDLLALRKIIPQRSLELFHQRRCDGRSAGGRQFLFQLCVLLLLFQRFYVLFLPAVADNLRLPAVGLEFLPLAVVVFIEHPQRGDKQHGAGNKKQKNATYGSSRHHKHDALTVDRLHKQARTMYEHNQTNSIAKDDVFIEKLSIM